MANDKLTGMALAKRRGETWELLTSKRVDFESVLPRHMPAERFMRFWLQASLRKPELMQCTPQSVVRAMLCAASTGLDVSGVSAEAHLVPYRNKNGEQEANFQVGYQGWIALARNSGKVVDIYAECVHENDTFEIVCGLHRDLVHRPKLDGDRGPIRFVYAVGVFADGERTFVWATREEVDAHKEKFSKAWKRAEESWYGKPPRRDSAWHENWPIMARKTLVIMLAKWLPRSVEVDNLLAVDSDSERFTGTPIVDVQPGADEKADPLLVQYMTADVEEENEPEEEAPRVRVEDLRPAAATEARVSSEPRELSKDSRTFDSILERPSDASDPTEAEKKRAARVRGALEAHGFLEDRGEFLGEVRSMNLERQKGGKPSLWLVLDPPGSNLTAAEAEKLTASIEAVAKER